MNQGGRRSLHDGKTAPMESCVRVGARSPEPTSPRPHRIRGAVYVALIVAGSLVWGIPPGTAAATHSSRYTRVGVIQENSNYSSVGGGKVTHPAGGHQRKDGGRVVWQTTRHSLRPAWSGPLLDVPTKPSKAKSAQKVCFVLKPVRRSGADVSFWIRGRRNGGKKFNTVLLDIVGLPSRPRSYEPYCYRYDLGQNTWTDLKWEIFVGDGGPVRIDRISLFQGGSGPSIIREIRAQPQG